MSIQKELMAQTGPDSSKIVHSNNSLTDDKSLVYTWASEMPIFPGGDEGFTKFIQETLVFPKSAVMEENEAMVYISFIINTDGSVSEVYALPRSKPIDPLFEKAAVATISASPRWMPAKNNGVPVPVKKIAKIKFTKPTLFPIKR